MHVQSSQQSASEQTMPALKPLGPIASAVPPPDLDDAVNAESINQDHKEGQSISKSDPANKLSNDLDFSYLPTRPANEKKKKVDDDDDFFFGKVAEPSSQRSKGGQDSSRDDDHNKEQKEDFPDSKDGQPTHTDENPPSLPQPVVPSSSEISSLGPAGASTDAAADHNKFNSINSHYADILPSHEDGITSADVTELPPAEDEEEEKENKEEEEGGGLQTKSDSAKDQSTSNKVESDQDQETVKVAEGEVATTDDNSAAIAVAEATDAAPIGAEAPAAEAPVTAAAGVLHSDRPRSNANSNAEADLISAARGPGDSAPTAEDPVRDGGDGQQADHDSVEDPVRDGWDGQQADHDSVEDPVRDGGDGHQADHAAIEEEPAAKDKLWDDQQQGQQQKSSEGSSEPTTPQSESPLPATPHASEAGNSAPSSPVASHASRSSTKSSRHSEIGTRVGAGSPMKPLPLAPNTPTSTPAAQRKISAGSALNSASEDGNDADSGNLVTPASFSAEGREGSER